MKARRSRTTHAYNSPLLSACAKLTDGDFRPGVFVASAAGASAQSGNIRDHRHPAAGRGPDPDGRIAQKRGVISRTGAGDGATPGHSCVGHAAAIGGVEWVVWICLCRLADTLDRLFSAV